MFGFGDKLSACPLVCSGLFAWNLSYFSAKIRVYLRFKEFHGALSYEEVLATQDIIDATIKPAGDSTPRIQQSLAHVGRILRPGGTPRIPRSGAVLHQGWHAYPQKNVP